MYKLLSLQIIHDHSTYDVIVICIVKYLLTKGKYESLIHDYGYL